MGRHGVMQVLSHGKHAYDRFRLLFTLSNVLVVYHAPPPSLVSATLISHERWRDVSGRISRRCAFEDGSHLVAHGSARSRSASACRSHSRKIVPLGPQQALATLRKEKTILLTNCRQRVSRVGTGNVYQSSDVLRRRRNCRHGG